MYCYRCSGVVLAYRNTLSLIYFYCNFVHVLLAKYMDKQRHTNTAQCTCDIVYLPVSNCSVQQYNLGTQILTSHSRNVFEVESPDWEKFPATFNEYTVDGDFDVACQAFVPFELQRPDVNAVNELTMSK